MGHQGSSRGHGEDDAESQPGERRPRGQDEHQPGAPEAAGAAQRPTEGHRGTEGGTDDGSVGDKQAAEETVRVSFSNSLDTQKNKEIKPFGEKLLQFREMFAIAVRVFAIVVNFLQFL